MKGYWFNPRLHGVILSHSALCGCPQQHGEVGREAGQSDTLIREETVRRTQHILSKSKENILKYVTYTQKDT